MKRRSREDGRTGRHMLYTIIYIYFIEYIGIKTASRKKHSFSLETPGKASPKPNLSASKRYSPHKWKRINLLNRFLGTGSYSAGCNSGKRDLALSIRPL